MGMLKEFKEFAMKGNLVDMAVAFVMGISFAKIVTALNEGMVMPMVGLLLGGFDLSKKKYVLKDGVDAVKDAAGNELAPPVAEVSLKWGAFITATIDFIIIAFIMFLIIRYINSMKKKEEVVKAADPVPTLSEKLLMEIRDAVKR